MSKQIIEIGMVVNYPNVHNEQISGKVETILENTVIIRDSEGNTHLISKKIIRSDNCSVGKKTNDYKTQFSIHA